MSSRNALPIGLIDAFKATETVNAVGVLMVDDGFDAEAMRVLAAWQHLDQRWTRPKEKQPDDGRPTPRAWAWLVAGWDVDATELAQATGLNTSLAREKLEILRGSRLIYPDGKMAKSAVSALNRHVLDRLNGKEKGKSKTDDKPKKKEPPVDGAN